MSSAFAPIADSAPIALVHGDGDLWAEAFRQQVKVHVDAFPTAFDLRRALNAGPRGIHQVVIGELAMPHPLNAAAAIVRDGRARSVILVCSKPSDELRERAMRAGIASVLDPSGLFERFGVARPLDGRTALGSVGAGAGGPMSAGMAMGAGAPSRAIPGEAPSARAPQSPSPVALSPAAQPFAGPSPSPPMASAMPSALPDPMGSSFVAMGPSANGAISLPGGAPPKNGPKLVFVSGRGGVGKSAVCALTAATAASWGLDVALVDLDLGFGNLFGYFGLDGPADLTRLRTGDGVEELSLCGRRALERVTLFGPCAKPEYAETVAPKITEMLDALSAAHDLVVVDGGTSWGDGVAQSVQAADRLFVCSDERAGAVGTLARVCSLAVRLGVARTRICMLINRCDSRHHDEGFLRKTAEGFQGSRSIQIFDGGIEVGEVMSVGRAGELVGVANAFSESVAECLASTLTELGMLPDDDRALKAAGARRHGRHGSEQQGRRAA